MQWECLSAVGASVSAVGMSVSPLSSVRDAMECLQRLLATRQAEPVDQHRSPA